MGEGLITAFTTGVTAIKSDVISLLTVVVPIALILFGILFAISYGKRGLRVIAGR